MGVRLSWGSVAPPTRTPGRVANTATELRVGLDAVPGSAQAPPTRPTGRRLSEESSGHRPGSPPGGTYPGPRRICTSGRETGRETAQADGFSPGTGPSRPDNNPILMGWSPSASDLLDDVGGGAGYRRLIPEVPSTRPVGVSEGGEPQLNLVQPARHQRCAWGRAWGEPGSAWRPRPRAGPCAPRTCGSSRPPGDRSAATTAASSSPGDAQAGVDRRPRLAAYCGLA